jgi:CRP-like cAMP-binding protein
VDPKQSQNRLIRLMGKGEVERLGPHFSEHSLTFKETLYEQNANIDAIYFPESGVISMVTELETGDAIECGTIGNEGFAGLPIVLGARRAAWRAICQIPGNAVCLPAELLARERQHGNAWFERLLRYGHFTTIMIAQTAACNRLHFVEARMSRWLLMTHDRVDGDEFPMTQEFLAQMLGVARPTVNIAGAALERAGLIDYARGRVTILDRQGLESAACECYGRINRDLEDVFL